MWKRSKSDDIPWRDQRQLPMISLGGSKTTTDESLGGSKTTTDDIPWRDQRQLPMISLGGIKDNHR